MIFRGKRIQDYTASDISSLVENQVPESAILDYKRECNLALEQDKTEFIYDINAFYNTTGGCIVFGLEEEKDEAGKNTGIPKFPDVPVAIANFDQLKLRIEESIKQTTNPSIVNLSFSPLMEINGSHVFILGIPKLTALPSMVTYKNSGRFYKRKSTGKYQVDTYELFDLFAQNLIAQREVLEFVEQRREEVFADRFMQGITNENGMLIHIVPVAWYKQMLPNFADTAFKNDVVVNLPPPGQGSYNHRYCFEGLNTFLTLRTNEEFLTRFTLLFRNASIEAYTSAAIRPAIQNYNPALYCMEFLTIIKQQVQNAVRFYRRYMMEPPYSLSIKLNNVLNFDLIIHDNIIRRTQWPRIDFEFPPVMLTNDVNEVRQQVRQLADMLWQTAGSDKCPHNTFNQFFSNLNFD